MRIGIVLLATAFITVGIPLAAADETAPDCEANQPWVGYARFEPVRQIFVDDLGRPGGVNTCEGEHWDGQDTANSMGGSCSTASSTDPNALHVNLCQGANPNAAAGDDPLNPLGVRVSVNGAGSTSPEVYTSANIALVGRAAVYVDDSTGAVYLRDNTPGNVLATVVSTPRITQGHVSELDCDQAAYQLGAQTQDPSKCGRDNTAVTIEHALLA